MSHTFDKNNTIMKLHPQSKMMSITHLMGQHCIAGVSQSWPQAMADPISGSIDMFSVL